MLYTSFLTTSFFTISLNLLESTEIVITLSTPNLTTLLFKLFKLVGRFLILSLSNLSTSDLKLAKSIVLAKEGV